MKENIYKNINNVIVRKKLIKKLIEDGYNITLSDTELLTNGKILKINDISTSVYEQVEIDKYADTYINVFLSLIFGDIINDKSKELITIRNYDMINRLTVSLDLCVKKPILGFYTYIYHEQYNKTTWLIRYPGRTIGNIKVDKNNIIQSIKIYEDVDIYHKELIKEYLPKFIGYKMTIKGDNKDEGRI